jgi:hypothetical protein
MPCTPRTLQINVAGDVDASAELYVAFTLNTLAGGVIFFCSSMADPQPAVSVTIMFIASFHFFSTNFSKADSIMP